jgi:hypothetical protein
MTTTNATRATISPRKAIMAMLPPSSRSHVSQYRRITKRMSWSAGLRAGFQKDSPRSISRTQSAVLAHVTSNTAPIIPGRWAADNVLKDRASSIILFDFKGVRNAADAPRTQRRLQARKRSNSGDDKARRICISTRQRAKVGMRTPAMKRVEEPVAGQRQDARLRRAAELTAALPLSTRH